MPLVGGEWQDDPSKGAWENFSDRTAAQDPTFTGSTTYVPGTGWVNAEGAADYDTYAALVKAGHVGTSTLLGQTGEGERYHGMSLREIAETYGEFYDEVGFADEPEYLSSTLGADKQPRSIVREVPLNDGTGRVEIHYSDGSFEVVTRAPTPTGGDGPAGTATSGEMNEFKAAFYGAMNEIGLDNTLIKSLWSWAEKRFVDDSGFGAAQATVELYDQPAFRKRFSGIAALRDEEEPRRDIPSPAEYLQFEQDVIGSMTMAGMDAGSTNVDELVKNLVVNSVGLVEVNQRLAEAKRMVYDVPDEVRNTFLDWYGPQKAEANLMMTFLDPEDKWGGSWPDLREKSSTAEIGGWAKMYAGIDMTQTQEAARRISNLGLAPAQTWAKFATLREQESLFAENINERIDLDTETHGISDAFNIDVANDEGLTRFEIEDILTKRAERRASTFAGGGGALLSGATTGFGAANA